MEPLRFWVFDRRNNCLLEPEQAREHIRLSPSGEVLYAPFTTNVHLFTDGFVPLRSTGVMDSQDREIIEGHLVVPPSAESGERELVVWRQGAFELYQQGAGSHRHFSQCRVVGHALTDEDTMPETIPSPWDTAT